MITRFLCWLFGHRMWAKAYTGIPNGLRNPVTGEPGMFYVMERQPFCSRCGYEPHAEGDPPSEPPPRARRGGNWTPADKVKWTPDQQGEA